MLYLAVFLGIYQANITKIIGLVYPIIMSVKSLMNDQELATVKENKYHWLTYWICYGALAIVDEFGG